MTARALVLVLFLGGAAAASSQTGGTRSVSASAPAPGNAASAALLPGTVYDPALPSLAEVLGHPPGEWIVSPEEARRYLQALATAAPDRIRIVEYGRTWEDRPLLYAVIASARNLARLDDIKAGLASLADPRRTSTEAAEALIAELPAVVWLGYGVHGDEISSTDAALFTAYHLLAARGDDLVEEVLASTVIVLDPMQNPDGRARFVEHQRATLGRAPSSHPLAAERDQPWPRGRTNHYLFDLNRDLIALTQPESRARVRAALEWRPLVFVDAHEMGGESTYFFPPNALPSNPHVTAAQEETLELFGRNNARWFDRFGFDYFSREIFDFFYPGYIDTWATFQGGIGMTYEQASARGLVLRRSGGELLTYRDGVHRHFVASLATLETAARSRERLLRDFWSYRASAIEEGRRGETGATGAESARAGGAGGRAAVVREYVLPWRGDTSLVEELAGILVAQGIEVRRSTREVAACDLRFPAGSYFVSAAQPAGRFARTLLERGAEMQEVFVREQERRRRKGLAHEMYDVTAWSLPLLYGVESVACAEAAEAEALEPIERTSTALATVYAARGPGAAVAVASLGEEAAIDAEGGEAPLAYLVPWGSAAAARLLTAALARGLEVLGADAGLTAGGRSYPRGTLVVRMPAGDRHDGDHDGGDRDGGDRDDGDGLRSTVTAIAAATGAEAVPIASGWVDAGIGLGSDRMLALERPEVALAWNEPTSPGAAGAARWLLEHRLGLEVTAIRTVRLATADLDDFDVVVLPDGEGYRDVLEEAGAQNLTRFVERGGVLVAIAGAVAHLADPEVALLSVREESRAEPAESPDEGAAGEPSGGATAAAGITPTGPAATPVGSAGGAAADEPGSGRVPGTIIRGEAEYLAAIAAEDAPPAVVPGVLVRAVPDPDHWLTAGLPAAVNVMMEGSAIFTPLRLDQGTNALRFADASELVASGYLWEENREQLAWKPFAVVEPRGRGLVIGFTADPTFRGVLAGLEVLLANAVVRAPAHTDRSPGR